MRACGDALLKRGDILFIINRTIWRIIKVVFIWVEENFDVNGQSVSYSCRVYTIKRHTFNKLPDIMSKGNDYCFADLNDNKHSSNK